VAGQFEERLKPHPSERRHGLRFAVPSVPRVPSAEGGTTAAADVKGRQRFNLELGIGSREWR
jgi:hypothetical protein